MFKNLGSGAYTAKKQYRKFKQTFPEKELRGHTIDLPILLQENMWIDLNDSTALTKYKDK
jgi:hypothetical protein